MNAEQTARSIGEGLSCECGCARCSQDIYTLYRCVLDQAAWIKHNETRAARLTEEEREALLWLRSESDYWARHARLADLPSLHGNATRALAVLDRLLGLTSPGKEGT
jgi:hypothetical protein